MKKKKTTKQKRKTRERKERQQEEARVRRASALKSGRHRPLDLFAGSSGELELAAAAAMMLRRTR